MPRKEKTYHFIYRTTNLINGKYYYGMHSTNDLNDGYYGSGKRLRYSINKYGKENHAIEKIEFFNNRKDLAQKEKEIINLNEISNENCLNLTVGGEGGAIRSGTKHSVETKEKIRNSLLGKPLSDERKTKISISGKGKHFFIMTDEQKRKISIAKKGKKSSLKGIPRTDETKRKISEALKGKKQKVRKPLSDDTKRKISIANKGKIISEEQRKQISIRMKGKVTSEETKKKLSEKAKQQWERYRISKKK